MSEFTPTGEVSQIAPIRVLVIGGVDSNYLQEKLGDRHTFSHTAEITDIEQRLRENQCDAVFLDVPENSKPDQLLERIGQLRKEVPSMIPLLILSEPVDEETVAQGYMRGADAWLTKGEEPPALALFVNRLSEMRRIQSRLIDNISHELRTPITVINLYVDLLSRGVSPEKQAEYLAILKDEADCYKALLETATVFTRIDIDRLGLNPGPANLGRMVEKTVQSCQETAKKKEISLNYNPEAELLALMDYDRTTEILEILIDNAIQYTEVGGSITVSVEKTEEKGQAWASFTVTDTGVGIPEDELPFIFERFFRGRYSQKNQISGNGLSLAIAKETLRLQGGMIKVESKVNKGSSFTVYLPLAEKAKS